MSNRSLVPALEASIRYVKGKRWKAILDDASARVRDALADVDRHRHISAPNASAELMKRLEDYYVLAEQARQEMTP